MFMDDEKITILVSVKAFFPLETMGIRVWMFKLFSCRYIHVIGLCAGPVRTSTNETLGCPKHYHGYKSHNSIMDMCVWGGGCVFIFEGASDWLVTSCDFCIKHWIGSGGSY